MGACLCAFHPTENPDEHGQELVQRELLDPNEPFITLKPRGPASLQQTLAAANAIIARHRNVLKEAVPTRYVVGRPLGKGATGAVRLATRKVDGLPCAIKTAPKMLVANIESFLTEVAVLRKLDHPNIVKCLECSDDGICVHAVLEMCAGGDLFDWFLKLPSYTEANISSIMSDIVGAIAHCHERRIVHRDLKPENILFYRTVGSGKSNTMTVKICDFGCAFELRMREGVSVNDALNEPQMESLVGSSYYVAPEVLRQNGPYTAAVDMWSLGVITYLLISGFPPFDGDCEVRAYRCVVDVNACLALRSPRTLCHVINLTI